MKIMNKVLHFTYSSYLFNNYSRRLHFRIVFYLGIFSVLFSNERDKVNVNVSHITFVGTRFNVIQNGDTPNRYIWLHGDEQTARIALNHHVDQFGGMAFFIQSETREIPFRSTMIDPNRIFSRTGTYHALRKFKPDWSPGTLKKALDDIDVERQKFLDILMPTRSGILISVHNNFRGYNIHKEKDKSQKISIKKDQNPRDFIICTNLNDFESLSSGPYNVVLQNILPENDDGSLSWEALRRGVRYLNIETRLGYLTQQKKMLSFVENSLR